MKTFAVDQKLQKGKNKKQKQNKKNPSKKKGKIKSAQSCVLV